MSTSETPPAHRFAGANCLGYHDRNRIADEAHFVAVHQ